MDDVRAVMDAVGAERAAVIGVSEGGPMCTLFAATHPDRCLALVTLGAYARRNWAPDYPIGRRAEQDGWLRPTRRAVGHVRGAPVPGRAGAVDRRRRGGDRVVRVLPRARGEPVGRGGDHRHERGDRRPPRARRRCACRRSSCTATEEYLRAASEYMGERLPGARMVAVPGTDHLPWEGDQESVLAAIEAFFGELGHDGGRARADPHHRARGRGAGCRAGARALRVRALPRPRARRAGRPRPRELRRPGPRGPLRERAGGRRPRRCAPASTPASASCATTAAHRRRARDRGGRRRRGRSRARSSPPPPSRTSSPARASSSPSTAPSRSRTTARRTTGASSPSSTKGDSPV